MRIRNYKLLIPFLGLGHGLNDMIAGYFLGSLVQTKLDTLQIGIGLFLYNLLAFGGQYLVALVLEEIKKPKKFLLLAYGLNVSAIALFVFAPQISIVLAGIASAIYHVAGGTVCAEDNKATNIGLFAAPGVAGLIAGGFFAYEKIQMLWWLLAAAGLFFFLLSLLREKKNTGIIKEGSSEVKKIIFDRHDMIMILLLTVISLRSAIWNVFQLIHENNYEWLLAIAAAAFTGKIIGGWLADKIGWRLYIYTSLTLATPLITFFRNELFLFCIGIGLLQSGIPATTSLLIHSLKGKTERGIGLSFGAAIILGAIAFYTPLKTVLFSNYFLWLAAAAMIVLLFFSGKKRFSAES